MVRQFLYHFLLFIIVSITFLALWHREARRGWMNADADERVVMLSMLLITFVLVSLIVFGLVMTE